MPRNKETLAQKQQMGERKYWLYQQRSFPPISETPTTSSADPNVERLQFNYLQASQTHILGEVETENSRIFTATLYR